ncbi:MAG: hypothetical protein NTX56_17395 [Proteobacteria bacterium]|nr:hypothetical protein [Pseudomonadota bacterium]
MMKFVFLCLALTLLLSACSSLFTHTVYHQPKSAEGRVCTSQCFNAQQQCRHHQEALHAACENQHRYAMDAFKRCKEAGGKECKEPPSCSYPSYYECESDYKACFGACGGLMEELPGL